MGDGCRQQHCIQTAAKPLQIETWYLLIAYRKLSSPYHTSHDCVSVVRTTFKVNGKRQTLTLSQPKTPEPIVTKFECRDYVVDLKHQKN